MMSMRSPSSYLQDKYSKYNLLIGEFPGRLHLQLLCVPSKLQHQGIGTKVVKEVCEHADKRNKVLTVMPSDRFHSDLKKLRHFYSRFGFVQSSKDPKTMVRQPKRRHT
jgi:ribosomal protein S18 acetylase RimI-like enzyme